MDTPWDKLFKLYGDEGPPVLMRLFTDIPRNAKYKVVRLDRELVRKRRHLDEVYDVTGGPRPGIYVFEATTRFRQEVYERTGKYSLELYLHYEKPIYSHMVVLTSSGFPGTPPLWLGGEFGVVDVKVSPIVVPVWRLPVRLAKESPHVLPWTALLDSSEQDRDRAERLLYEHGDRELMARYALFMGLRFGDNEKILERMDAMLTREIIEESAFYKKILAKGKALGESKGEAKGKAKGKAEGKAEGKLAGERALLLRLLNAKFGAVPDTAVAKVMSADAAMIERWSLKLLTARTLKGALAE